MGDDTKTANVRDDIAALSAVSEALEKLSKTSQAWVLKAIIERLALGDSLGFERSHQRKEQGTLEKAGAPEEAGGGASAAPPADDAPPDETNSSVADDSIGGGISSVSKTWLKRTGIQLPLLSDLFSLNLDEIDVVSEHVPGANKKERMRSVLLLKCVASYLATGAARVPYDKAKEACIHYDAYDTNNWASYLKDFSKEITGGKETGYSLTPSGMTAAGKLILAILKPMSR